MTTTPVPASAAPRLRIEPSQGWAPLKLRELWEYRELVYFLVWRDVKVRYKQTILGAAWALFQPLTTVLVFSVFFGRLARVPSDGAPYPLFALAGLTPWMLFAHGLSQSANSLVGSAGLICKVYFPRLAIPVAAVLSGFVDFALTLALLLGMAWAQGPGPSLRMLWLPAFVLLATATALGVGLWCSALSVRYRDVRHLLPFLVQLWMLATPIAYPSSLLGEPWRTLYGLNPMVAVVEGFRWALLGTPVSISALTAISVLAAAALLAGGAFYFRSMERTFADVV